MYNVGMVSETKNECDRVHLFANSVSYIVNTCVMGALQEGQL